MILFLLNVRALLGWWRHPDELRATSARYLRVLPLLAAVLMIMLAIGPILILLANLPPAHRRFSPTLLREALRLAEATGMGYVPLILGPVLLLAVTSRLFARRGERGGESTVYGRCFAVLLDPPSHFFVRIGLTRDTAQWYGLPIDWDAVVEPSEAEFELTVLAGTGWVERLRRLGPNSRVLTQPVPELPERRQIAAPQPEDGEPAINDDSSNDELEDEPEEDEPEGATAEEKQALRRFARRADLGWRTSPANIACGGWTLVVGGLLLGPGLLVFGIVWALLSPRTFSDPGGRVGGIVFLIAMFVLGIGLIAWGLRYLRVWRRVRRSRHALPTSVTGEVLCWMPYGDMYSPSDQETLINLRKPDGHSHIFRIPGRYLHRVRKRGALVRITYLPTTERVQGVGYVEAPTHAAVGDSASST